MRTRVLAAFTMSTLVFTGISYAKERIDLSGVALSLGMARDDVVKELERFSLRKEGEGDYLAVYEAGSSKWIGSVQFKHGKLGLVIKSWDQVDDKTMNAVLKGLMGKHSSCGFAVAAVPGPGSPLKLTSFTCPDRRVVMQVNTDEAHGVFPCNVEIIGDPGNRLEEVKFWKACH